MAQTNTSTSDRPANGPGAFSMGNMDVPAAFREAAAESITQAKSAYDQMRVAGQGASEVAQATGESARSHTVALSLKALGVAKTNTEASFDFFTKLICAKTAAEAIELQTTFAKTMFDTFSAQVKDFTEATQNAAIDIAKPSQTAWNKVANQ